MEHHTSMKEYEQAIEILEEIYKRMEGVNEEFSSSIKYHIGDCYYKLERYEEAQSNLISSLSSLEKVAPKSTYLPPIYYLLGIINHKLNNDQIAVDYFQKAKDYLSNVPQQNQELQSLLSQHLDKFANENQQDDNFKEKK